MTARSLPVWSVIGLAAGITAGILFSRDDGGTASRPAISASHPVAAKTGDAPLPSAFSTDDERIVRIFSALREPVRLRQRLELFEAMRDLTAADMAALMKHAESLPKAIASELVMALAERWFELDPRAAAEWARASSMESGTMQIWAKADPDGAWRAAYGVDVTRADWQSFSQWKGAMLGTVMEKAPIEAFAQFSALPPGAERDRLLECAFMKSMWHTPREQLFGNGEARAWEFYGQLPEDAQIVKASLFGEKRAERGDLNDLGA